MHASSHSRLELMPTTVSAFWQDARCAPARGREKSTKSTRASLRASRACALSGIRPGLCCAHKSTHTPVLGANSGPPVLGPLMICRHVPSTPHLLSAFVPHELVQQWKTPVLSLRRIRDDSHAAMATISQDWLDVRRAAVSCRRSSPSPLPRARTPSWARGARTAGYPRTW